MTSVSAGHIIQTPTQPVGSGRPQRESNPGPPHQESRALPQSYRAPLFNGRKHNSRHQSLLFVREYNIPDLLLIKFFLSQLLTFFVHVNINFQELCVCVVENSLSYFLEVSISVKFCSFSTYSIARTFKRTETYYEKENYYLIIMSTLTLSL